MSTERELGDRWAATIRAWPSQPFVMKLPASSTAGIPDWLVVGAPYGAQLFEAKLALPTGEWAFDPHHQLTGAQRFILSAIARKWKPAAQLLILDETGYVEMNYTTRRLPRTVFNRRKRRYE